LWPLLDEIDYGLILVTRSALVQYANRSGLAEIANRRFLALSPWGQPHAASLGRIKTDASVQQTPHDLHAAIAVAARGERQMLTLKRADEHLSLALVPVGQTANSCRSNASDSGNPVLIMLARRPNSANAALSFFARAHGLSAAEESVLRALNEGQKVKSIALSRGVSESTITTQVRALCAKTSCRSIRDLLALLSNLPPMVSLDVAPAANISNSSWLREAA
jgi:DNA-binding CsgD family transcriptional regulator